MNTPIAELSKKVAAQAAAIPSMYGSVDFSITPERFTAESGHQTELEPEFAERRPALLANKEQVARIKAYTMPGDPVADAYAAIRFGDTTVTVIKRSITLTALSASSGCQCLSRGSQGDESETDHSDDGVAQQIVA